MFQQKQPSRAAISHEGDELRISVAPPGSVVDEWLAGALFLGMITGSFFGFWPLNPGRFALALVFSAAAFFIFRGMYEPIGAEQIVIVAEGKIGVIRKTRLWTRTRWLEAQQVTDVSPGSALGFAAVTITAKGRRHAVLNHIRQEDADRCASEIRHALGTV
jgi:hypothetical protein